MTVLPARVRALLLTLLGAIALGAATAAPASAQLAQITLPNGHSQHFAFDPMSGTAAAPAAARPFDQTFSNVDYNGGPVMPSNTNYVVIWVPSNYTGTAFQTGYTSGVEQFFTDLAASSGESTVTDAISSQYTDAAGQHAAFDSSYAGALIDTDPLPANGCATDASGHICITDAQLQTELDAFLSDHGDPADLTHEYFVLTPPGVASCFDSSSSQCSGNADQNLAYCAYHSESADNYIYANIPDMTGIDGCDPFVGDCPASHCNYDNGPADGVITAISHEHNESITDPDAYSGWLDMQSGCTSGSPETCGGEIGDKCVGIDYSDPNVVLQASGSTDTPYSQTLNGHHYLIQRLWSNQTHSCEDGFTPNGTDVSASFSASTQSTPGVVDFNAGASTSTDGVARYVWQFDDGPGVNYTVETSSPTIEHTFTSSGDFDVALTVMGNDGTSAVSTSLIMISNAGSGGSGGSGSGSGGGGGGMGAPTAAFTMPSSAQAGSVVLIDGSDSSDPNPGQSLSYLWSFGDGGSASGVRAAHVFAPGTYTVTLTVLDTYGLSSTVSHQITVSASTGSPSGPGSTGGGTTGSGAGSGSSGSGSTNGHTTTAVCTVPHVTGRTLTQARAALAAAHCETGRVKSEAEPRRRAPKHEHWVELVIRQALAPGDRERLGTKIALTLGWRAERG